MIRFFIFLIFASATALPAATKEISSRQLLSMVTENLQKTFEINDAKLVLSPTRQLPAVPVPADAHVEVQIVSHQPNGPAAFIRTQYALLVDGRRMGEWTGFFRAQLLKEVWLAGKIAPRHATLDKVKLIRKKVDVINLRTGVWEGKPDSTLQLTQGLSTGMVLLPRHVRRTPVILRNQLVTGVLIYKALRIELSNLLALEEGAPGDTIRLRNNSSFKEIRGKIINDRSVLLGL